MTEKQRQELCERFSQIFAVANPDPNVPFEEFIYDALLKAFIAGAEYAQTHPNWISVEDELPTKRKDPLVISDKVFIRTTGGHYLSAVYDYQDKQWIDVYNIETLESNEVTHWMPIMPPRKEDKNE